MVKGYSGYERALQTSPPSYAPGNQHQLPGCAHRSEKSVNSGVTRPWRWSRLSRSRPARTFATCTPSWSTPKSDPVRTPLQRRGQSHNNRIQRFPDLLIASTSPSPAEFFDADEQATAAPAVVLS
jgi:hypothetical protein